ncbi:MAG: hypothetical protein CVU39_03940 [Chloroflexi bacterium HGW-Chloroflexi-10]|nr:MAG: hypothetical protein CVU39_03940 [Chloroflexi bacterium HGW-Chloroflexi-10]
MTTRLLNLPALPKWWQKKFTIALIVLFSILLHFWTVWQLPIDFDEPVYLSAAKEYGQFIQNGDINGIVNNPENREHPALVKLLYAIPFVMFPEEIHLDLYVYLARTLSALMGVLTVWMVARVNPWSGLLLALHSMTLKYSSQAYLEAVPQFLALMAVLFMIRAVQTKTSIKSFFYSAIFLGGTAAAKYPYLIIIVVLLYLGIQSKFLRVKDWIVYSGIALVVFYILNPSVWLNPFGEIISNLNFHIVYSQSAHVQSSGYPWYQPVLFLFTSVQWHPNVFFFVTTDEIMFMLAIFGIYFEVKEKNWSAVWCITGLLFLLVWPTKWPQYTMVLTPVLAIIAGKMIQRSIDWIRPREDYWNYLEEMLPQPPKILWWLLSGFILVLGLGKVGYEVNLAISRLGWNSFTQIDSPLNSDIVNQIFTGMPGEIVIVSDKGINFWYPNSDSYWGGTNKRYSINNTPLASDRITSGLYDNVRDSYWFGSDQGVILFDHNDWLSFGPDAMGCTQCFVNELLLDEQYIWAATNEGIFQFDGAVWINFSKDQPGLENTQVLSLVIREFENTKELWAGTISGISRFSFDQRQWQNEDWAGRFFGWGGVSDLFVTADQTIIACTSGGGIGVLKDNAWVFWQTSNYPFRTNTVNHVAEDENGALWFGFGFPTEPGGYVMKKDIEGNWRTFAGNNSGYFGGEVQNLFFDEIGQLWIATNGTGIQTFYKPEK